MRVILIRHSETPGNAMLRYIGRTDEELSPLGRRQAAAAKTGFSPEKVFVSALRRTAQTAALIFPKAERIPLPGLNEMDFGSFEGRSFTDMESDALYRQWVEGGCIARCPGGESRGDFTRRVLDTFGETVRSELALGSQSAVFVVHGGTIMAIMSGCAGSSRDYFEWSVKNCRGYEFSLELSPTGEFSLSDIKNWGES